MAKAQKKIPLKEEELNGGVKTLAPVTKADLRPMVQEDRSLVPYDPLQRYLLEIKHYRLLTREEEMSLAIAVRDRQDQEAAYKLVTSNLRLVVKIRAIPAATEIDSPPSELL